MNQKVPALAAWLAASLLMGCVESSEGETGTDGGSGGQGGGVASDPVTTTGTGGAGGEAGTGWPGGCDAFQTDTCGDCVESKCCAETEACMEDVDCAATLTGQASTGATGPLYTALATCATSQCGPVMEFHPGSNCGGESPCYDIDRWVILDNPCHFAPPQWTCDPSEYDQTWSDPSNAVCQCTGCGFWDPDCDAPNTPNDCGPGDVCNPGPGPCSGCLAEGVACA